MKGAWLFAAALLASAALADVPSPGEENVLPVSGMKFRAFRDMRPQPLPLPAIRAERRSDRAKLYSELEWWRSRQTAGIWGGDGCRVMVGELLLEPPVSDRNLATTGELEKRYPVSSRRAEWDDAKLKQWIRAFTGNAVSGFRAATTKIYDCVWRRVLFTGAAGSRTRAYLIAPDREPARRMLLVYELENGTFTPEWERAVLRSLGSVQFFRPEQDASARRIEAGRGGGATATNTSDSWQESRRRVIDNIRNFRDWWYLETENYIFVSNQEDRRSMIRLRRDLERARSAFAAHFPMRGKPDAVSVVRIFGTREEYLSYVGKELQWSGGVWVPAREELVISPIDARAPENVQQEIIRQVAFHEGFHQYIHYALGRIPVSLWFNEGAAQYFEGIEFRGGKPEVRLDERSETKLRRTFRRVTAEELSALVAMDYQTFYGENRDRNYPLAQGLVYYLLKGAPVAGKQEYARIIPTYYRELAKSGDPAAATRAAFGRTNFRQLAADLVKFWDSDRLIRRSIRYNPVAGNR